MMSYFLMLLNQERTLSIRMKLFIDEFGSFFGERKSLFRIIHNEILSPDQEYDCEEEITTLN